MQCTAPGLLSSPYISSGEQGFWLWLRQQLTSAISARPGDRHVEIKAYHFRSMCVDPNRYWGTIVVMVDFADRRDNDPGVVANFDRTKSGGRIRASLLNTTRTGSEDYIIALVIEMVLAEMKI